MIAAAWHWFSASDAHVGSTAIVLGFVLFIALFLLFARDEQRKDAAARIDLAPVYRDEAGHAAWLAEFRPEEGP